MNCLEFKNRVVEFAGGQVSGPASHDALVQHAANCFSCAVRLETERALTGGLQALAVDERKIEAPSSLRNDLLVAFENRVEITPATILSFPSRSNWTRWALAAAATIILGFILFSARWSRLPATIDTAHNVVPDTTAKTIDISPSKPIDKSEVTALGSTNDSTTSPRAARRNPRRISPVKPDNTATQVASTEVKSEFVPLTYLNNATAMESGIVVRVEIAREQLATLGLPFDLDRADDTIKADIVVGDDGVARAIRLVQ